MATTSSSTVSARRSQNRSQCLQGMVNWMSTHSCAPLTSSQDHKQQFFQVWLSSLVTTRISHEHEFTYYILHIDGFRHPLLHGVPFDKSAGEDEYRRDAFLASRVGIINGERSYGKANEPYLSLISQRLSTTSPIV
jgi:hypothetical protein